MVLFSISSIMRLVQTGRIALSDYAADRPAIFPMVKVTEVSSDTILFGFFRRDEVQEEIKKTAFDAVRVRYFEEDSGKLYIRDSLDENDKDALSTLRFMLLKNNLKELSISTFKDIPDLDTGEIAGAYLVKQWGDSSAERGPLARILFTVGAIAAEFIQVDPAMFGNNSRGDKFLRGFSVTISDLLNQYIEQSSFNGKAEYAEHALALAMRASLSTLQQNPSLVVSEKHIELLISNTLKPVIDAIPETFSVNDQLDFKVLSEAFTGPAINAALTVISDNSSDFLGDRFDKTKAAGMLAGALLSKLASQGVQQSLSSEGVFELYKAALTVVAETPELLIKQDGTTKQEDQIIQDVFNNIINTLKDVPGPFDVYFKDVPVMILAASLEAVGKNVTARSSHNEWENVATDIAGKILKAFATELKKPPMSPPEFSNRFKKSQLVELSRIVLNHIAATPEMTGVRIDEINQIIGAVAQAMVADEKLLLTDNNWKKIAAVAAQEAASNPGRLFAIDTNDKSRNLAAELIKLLLENAAKTIISNEDEERAVLFGDTLEQAITLTLRTYSGAPQLAEEQLDLVSENIIMLIEFVTKNSALYGSKEWLKMYRSILSINVNGGNIISLENIEDANKLLER